MEHTVFAIHDEYQVDLKDRDEYTRIEVIKTMSCMNFLSTIYIHQGVEALCMKVVEMVYHALFGIAGA